MKINPKRIVSPKFDFYVFSKIEEILSHVEYNLITYLPCQTFMTSFKDLETLTRFPNIFTMEVILVQIK